MNLSRWQYEAANAGAGGVRMNNDTWLTAAIYLELKRLADTDEDATRVVQLAMDNDVPFPPGTFRVSDTIRVTTEETA